MEENKLAIAIQHLSKSVKKKQLVQPLDYQLQQGKVLVLCGGNGAGKSTLIRLIAGLIQPTTGQVLLNGLHHKKHKRDFTKQFGYMPDDFLFQPTLTAKETIRFYAKLRGIGKARWEEVLNEVGLIDVLHEKVGTFSKGMKQRLLLAQALLANPAILLLDEPTNGLDPFWIKEFSNLILKAKAKGQTIIFSTHELHVAEQLADEVMFLSDGKVIRAGAMAGYREVGLYETFQQIYFESV